MRLLAQIILQLAALLLAVSAVQAQQKPVWPTAGGAGGREIAVTTLADEGPGSLRAALAAEGPRTVTFRVAGDIFIRRPLVIDEPFITVAGETAASPGITVLGDKLRIKAHDVILRHLRLRVGEVGKSDPVNRDGISIEGAKAEDSLAGRILIDHCSVAWAVDEGLSMWGEGLTDIAVRNSIVAETLRDSIHPKGSHAMGMMVGPGIGNALVERNLLASNAWRNPVVHGGASAVVINNVIYNPGYAGLHLYPHEESGPTLLTAVGNVLIAGPDTRPVLKALAKGVNAGSRLYYRDNLAVGAKAFDAHEHPEGASPQSLFVREPPIWLDGLPVLAAAKTEEAVLADVGARPWDRDATDRRIVGEVTARSGRIRNHPLDARLVRPPAPRAKSKGETRAAASPATTTTPAAQGD